MFHDFGWHLQRGVKHFVDYQLKLSGGKAKVICVNISILYTPVLDQLNHWLWLADRQSYVTRERRAALKFLILAVRQDGKLTENLNLGFITLRWKTFSIGMRKFTGVLRYFLA